MRSPEEESTGPVIRDRRRIDPVTGQVRDPGQSGSTRGAGSPLRGGQGSARPGKHAGSKPGGTSGTKPDGTSGAAPGPADGNDQRGGQPGSPASPAGPGNGPGGSDGPGGSEAGALARLAERTADLQRLQAEYANYRKRVERDRAAVREQALANVLAALLPILDDIGRAREHEELAGGFKSVAESLESATAKLGLTSYGENGDPFDPNLHEALMHSYSADVAEPTCATILQPGYKIGDRILRPARVAVAEPGDLAGPGGQAGSGDQDAADAAKAPEAGPDGESRADGEPPRANDPD
jgi:molecular chaperone GrpE